MRLSVKMDLNCGVSKVIITGSSRYFRFCSISLYFDARVFCNVMSVEAAVLNRCRQICGDDNKFNALHLLTINTRSLWSRMADEKSRSLRMRCAKFITNRFLGFMCFPNISDSKCTHTLFSCQTPHYVQFGDVTNLTDVTESQFPLGQCHLFGAKFADMNEIEHCGARGTE